MRTAGPLVVGPLVLLVAMAAGAAQTDQAASVMAAARTALGGEARIGRVKTLVVTGRTRQLRGDNLIPIEFEIQIEFPAKYARRDEFPAQDAGPATVGFNGDALVQIPVPPAQQDAAMRARLDGVRHEFARLMLGLFATSFEAPPPTFGYAGQAEAPQGKADVIDVKGAPNFASRLFISSDTHLPIMVSWSGPPPGGRGGAGPPVEQRLYFGDYREVDGHQFPFRLRRASGGDTIEETTVDRFRINVRVDSRRFATSN